MAPQRSVRTYQRKIAMLKQIIRDMQWVQPAYNGNPSCAGCGSQKHNGCEEDCPAAQITGDRGGR